MKNWYIFLILLILGDISCKEKYSQAVDAQINAIVVEGLLTNLKEPYQVILSNANQFNSTTEDDMVSGAKVTILDDLKNIYSLHENAPGKYYTDSAIFTAILGRSYTLQIELPGGDLYESSPQKLLPPVSVDSIYGNITNKEYWEVDPLGNINPIYKTGSDNFMNLNYFSDSIFQFRFDNTLMIGYNYIQWYTETMKNAGEFWPLPGDNECDYPICGYMVFKWHKFDLKTNINLTPTTHLVNSRKLKGCSVCFSPNDRYFVPLLIFKEDSCNIDRTVCGQVRRQAISDFDILSTRIYALNQASSIFYQELNAQISSQGKLFEPITVQLQGNISCINNPAKLALGFFEVSSCTKTTYLLQYNYSIEKIKYIPFPDIAGRPDSLSQTVPDWWPAF